MLDSDRRAQAHASRNELGSFLHEHAKLIHALKDMHAGFPSGRSAPGGQDQPDRTFSAATGKDPARRDLQRVDQLITEISSRTRELDSLRRQYLHPVQPSRDQDTEGCEIAALAGGWEALHRFTDLDGLLPRKYRLGRWAYDWAIATGDVPTVDEMDRHLRGVRVRRPAPSTAIASVDRLQLGTRASA